MVGTSVMVRVRIGNLTLAPDSIGKANVPGEGHWHIFLDGRMVQPVGAESFTLTGLTPGPHTITVALHNNDHSPVSPVVATTVRIMLTAAPALPKTGDGDLMPVWADLIAVLMVLTGVAIRLRVDRARD